MARRLRKSEAKAIGTLVVIGIPIFIAVKIFEAVGWVVPVAVVVAAIALYVWYVRHERAKRLEYLRAKYHDETLVQKIFDGYFWQGQTAEQLTDSLGHPVAVDDKRLKTKTKEIWKYHHQSANRYALRITVENGVVVGWEKKHNKSLQLAAQSAAALRPPTELRRSADWIGSDMAECSERLRLVARM